MEREEANEKARGKWRWHLLGIDWSVGRLAAQKGERRPLVIDRLSFGLTGHKKRQRRRREAKWSNGRLRWSPKKPRGKWRWHLLAIDRSTDQSATQKGERRPLAINRSSFGLTGGETEEPNEKGKRQAAMTATCNDCIFNRSVTKKRGSQIFFTKDDVASAHC